MYTYLGGMAMDKILTIYFSADGRIRRLPYFLYGLGIGVVYLVLSIIMTLALGMGPQGPEPSIGAGMGIVYGIFIFLVIIVLTYASFILIIKRLHDLDHSGWFSLVSLVPLLNFLMVIYLLFFKGTDGPNRFGNPQP